MERDMEYIGLLANVDSTFLCLEFPGFTLEKVAQQEMVMLVAALTKDPPDNVFTRLMVSACYDHVGECFYALRRSYKNEFPIDKHNVMRGWGSGMNERLRLMNKEVTPRLNLLRLFGEGNLGIVEEYDYYREGEGLRRFTSSGHAGYGGGSIYKVDLAKLSEIGRFLSETQLPFTDSTLNLAHQFYESSYRAHPIGLAYITLMTGMEVLFNKGKDPLAYTISRYVAVLLGGDREDSKRLFKEMKNHYERRSTFIHAGNLKNIDQIRVCELRALLRCCILTLYRRGWAKERYLDELHELGYGGRADFLNAPAK